MNLDPELEQGGDGSGPVSVMIIGNNNVFEVRPFFSFATTTMRQRNTVKELKGTNKIKKCRFPFLNGVATTSRDITT